MYEIEISKKEQNVIFSSRTAWYFIPDSFKIYLTTCDEEAAKRIYSDKERINEKKYSSLEEVIENVKKRNMMEPKRYMDVYGIDVTDKDNYDIYIDTTNMNVEDILNVLIENYEKWLKGKE